MDRMAMTQKIRGDQKTFAEVAESLMYMVLNEETDSQHIDVVFDVYRDNSIKNPRQRREALKQSSIQKHKDRPQDTSMAEIPVQFQR